MKNFHLLDIHFVDRQGNPIEFEINSAVPSRKSLSNSWSINCSASILSGDRNSFTLQIKSKTNDTQSDSGSVETADGHKLFRQFLIHMDVHRNLETD